jgi:hypothetical protein
MDYVRTWIMLPEYELKDAGKLVALFSSTSPKYLSRLTDEICLTRTYPGHRLLWSSFRWFFARQIPHIQSSFPFQPFWHSVQNHVDIVTLGFLFFLQYNEIACIVMHITLVSILVRLYIVKYQNLVDIIIHLHRARRELEKTIKKQCNENSSYCLIHDV